jgi:ABC-2 type transport system permease protein
VMAKVSTAWQKLGLVIGFILFVLLSNFFWYRLDITAEKRFTISNATQQLVSNLPQGVAIDVYLTGTLPSDYKKLSIAVQEFTNELQQYATNGNLPIRFLNPQETIKNDTLLYQTLDSLAAMGVVFERSSTDIAVGKKEQFIIPSAIVSFNNAKPIVIDLRSSKTIYKPYNVITEQPVVDVEATRNAAEALLEFKFANAIHKLTRTNMPTVAYVVGNGQPTDKTVNDLGESLRNEYKLGIFNLKAAYPNANAIAALLMVKPKEKFTDEDKLKLDQYVMNGGKIIWCIDKLHAELDSLQRTEAQYIAFDRGLNIDDLLFKYGVRINPNLLQDLNCAKLPIVVGYNPDKSPRMQRIPWPYYPLLSSTSQHVITKNLDRVLPIFPSGIDTVAAPNITKTILLQTDTNSRALASPALVSMNSIKDEADFASFTKSHIPVAVLLEGKFQSLFANRISLALQDSIKNATGIAFAKQGKPTRQIVIADADIVTNDISTTTGPLPMGVLKYDGYRFANKEFLLNCIDYLVDSSGIFTTRNKEFQLRLLDKAAVENNKLQWQIINTLLPIAIIVFLGIVLQWNRKRIFAKTGT